LDPVVRRDGHLVDEELDVERAQRRFAGGGGIGHGGVGVSNRRRLAKWATARRLQLCAGWRGFVPTWAKCLSRSRCWRSRRDAAAAAATPEGTSMGATPRTTREPRRRSPTRTAVERAERATRLASAAATAT